MALSASIFKADIDISDLRRHYYHSHSLTLARHPSETNERMMLRLLSFALFADEQLSFTRGLSNDDEPDLWRHSLSGETELWIELGSLASLGLCFLGSSVWRALRIFREPCALFYIWSPGTKKRPIRQEKPGLTRRSGLS